MLVAFEAAPSRLRDIYRYLSRTTENSKGNWEVLQAYVLTQSFKSTVSFVCARRQYQPPKINVAHWILEFRMKPAWVYDQATSKIRVFLEPEADMRTCLPCTPGISDRWCSYVVRLQGMTSFDLIRRDAVVPSRRTTCAAPRRRNTIDVPETSQREHHAVPALSLKTTDPNSSQGIWYPQLRGTPVR
jgi:hypothetical protein